MSDTEELLDRADTDATNGSYIECEMTQDAMTNNAGFQIVGLLYLVISAASIITLLRVHLWVETALLFIIPTLLRLSINFFFFRKSDEEYSAKKHVTALVTANIAFDFFVVGYLFTIFGWRTFVFFYMLVTVISPMANGWGYRMMLLKKRMKKLAKAQPA